MRVGDHAGFSRAGSRQDEHRPVIVFDGFALRGVEQIHPRRAGSRPYLGRGETCNLRYAVSRPSAKVAETSSPNVCGAKLAF